MAVELDAEVKRFDQDRWLASRFAPADARARLMALYGLNLELARIVAMPGEGAARMLRLAWWRDAAADACEGRLPGPQPALAALAAAARETRFDKNVLAEMINAQALALAPEESEGFAALERFAEAGAGGLMRLAAQACGVDVRGENEALIAQAGRAWGLWASLETPLGQVNERSRIIAHAHEAYARVRGRIVETALFPALGYVRLLGGALRAAERGRAAPSPLSKQFTLVAAAMRGAL